MSAVDHADADGDSQADSPLVMDRHEAVASAVIRIALEEWTQKGLISKDVCQAIQTNGFSKDVLSQASKAIPSSSLPSASTNQPLSAAAWSKFTKYAFWGAIACFVIAVGVFLAQARTKLFTVLGQNVFLVEAILLAIGSVALFVAGMKRLRIRPEAHYSNEAVFFFASVFAWSSGYEFDFYWNSLSGSSLVGMYTVLFAVVGILVRSNLVWVLSMVNLGLYTARFDVMNGPVTSAMNPNDSTRVTMYRFVVLGLLLIIQAVFVFPREKQRLAFHSQTTLIVGLLWYFVPMVPLSLNTPLVANSYEPVLWSLALFASCIVSIYCGVRFRNSVSKGFGLVFAFVFLFVKFFEFGYTTLNKGVFFAMLGAGLWVVGTRFELIWTRMEAMMGTWIRPDDDADYHQVVLVAEVARAEDGESGKAFVAVETDRDDREADPFGGSATAEAMAREKGRW